jgi:hypothetical protein
MEKIYVKGPIENQVPPRGWIGGWRQGDLLRTTVTSLSATFVTVLVLAAPSHFRVTFTLHTYDLIVEISYELLGFRFRCYRTMLATIVIPVDITVSRYDAGL